MRAYDPNVFRAGGSVGAGVGMDAAPIWEQVGGGKGVSMSGAMRRFKIQTNETAMESVPLDQRERCAYLNAISVEIQGIGGSR